MAVITAALIREHAAACGFELAGVAAALPHEDFSRFETWRAGGLAGEMRYLTDHRGDLRQDPRSLLPSAASIICVGKLYNTPLPAAGAISRYAWGADYHEVMRDGLQKLVQRLSELTEFPFEHRICVDTAPLLERSYAQAAGLGWIGKNTCLINQEQGSWFFLGEALISLPIAPDNPPPGRCGTCTRCIDACPTGAIHPSGFLDARTCISYLTIEKRSQLDASEGTSIGNHAFGCDICQDVCPWNRRAPVTDDERFAPAHATGSLAELAALSSEEFRSLFRHSPVWRAKYQGFLRNVAWALGNASQTEPLRRLLQHPDPAVSAAASAALENLFERTAGALSH